MQILVSAPINSLIGLILYHLIIHNYTNRISTNKYTIASHNQGCLY